MVHEKTIHLIQKLVNGHHVTVSQLSAKAYSGFLNFNKSRAVTRELGLKKRTKNKKEIFEKGKGKAREKQ